MDEQNKNRLKYWGPLLISITLIVGMTIGFKLRDSLRTKRSITTIIERNDRLEQIIDLIDARYVDSINKNLLYRDAVNGIISHLDPHTVYISADKLQGINEDLQGSFFGIGVEFSIVRDTILITSVIEEGPAELAGINIGDKLIKVGDSTVAGTGITSERIIGMLKGKQFSKVFLTLMEPGDMREKVVSIKRDAVPKYSIDASIMLDSITGLIKINRFSATTYAEFKKALNGLQKKGMQSLIVDLRQNSGGYMEPAKQIADEFLSGDKLIVFTKGENSVAREYVAGKKGDFEQGKLAILIDEQSASASEILAGAIQDWDRGVLVGRRTYGKGLVQDQYDLEDGSALRLTIAKYYIPSGRSIQRSFENGRDEYESDFLERFHSGELTGNDSVYQADTTKYYTAKNRVVYGGGGISPDIYVPYDTTKLSSVMLNLIYSDGVKNVVWDYYILNRVKLKNYTSIDSFRKKFKSDTLVANYLNNQDRATEKVLKEILSNKENKNYFKLHLKAQLARLLFRDNGFYTILFSDDNVVLTAKKALQAKRDSLIVVR